MIKWLSLLHWSGTTGQYADTVFTCASPPMVPQYSHVLGFPLFHSIHMSWPSHPGAVYHGCTSPVILSLPCAFNFLTSQAVESNSQRILCTFYNSFGEKTSFVRLVNFKAAQKTKFTVKSLKITEVYANILSRGSLWRAVIYLERHELRLSSMEMDRAIVQTPHNHRRR